MSDATHISETDAETDADADSVVNDENTFDHYDYSQQRRSPSLLLARDTPLRDITDQFFHPPSPSPVRVSKLKRAPPHIVEPPRRPKKPKSLAYPADPPNWLYARSSSSLPPSSPFPPSDRDATARYEYNLGTPSKASDSDPFGFIAVERALKAKRPPVPHKPSSRINVAKSPLRSTVPPSADAPSFTSFTQLDGPIPTNNEDIEGLYADEPVAGPSHVHVPVAPLLRMSSDRPWSEVGATRLQATFPDPLRTPRKRKRRASPTPTLNADPDPDDPSIPSSPSPVKISVGAGTHRHSSSYIPTPKLTRARTRAAGNAKPLPTRSKRVKTSDQRIPTPSSTPVSVRPSVTSRQSTAPPTPVPPRRSTRQAAVGARAKLRGTSTTNDAEDGGRMKLRSRSTKSNAETKTTTQPATRTKQPQSKPKAPTRNRRATTTMTARPARGGPKGKTSTKGAKGKGKTRPLESVLDLSDDTREKYEKERRERLEYFKRLEGYQIQKENVYVV